MSPYRSLVFVHVLSILVLMLCHGAAFTVSHVLRQERRPERIGVLLDISLASFDSRRALGRIFWIDLIVVGGSGIGLKACPFIPATFPRHDNQDDSHDVEVWTSEWFFPAPSDPSVRGQIEHMIGA